MDIYAVICIWSLFIFVNAKKDIDYDYLGLAIVGEEKDPPKQTVKKPDGSDIILLRLKNPVANYEKYIGNGGALDEDLAKIQHDLRCGCSAGSAQRAKSNENLKKETPNGLPASYINEYYGLRNSASASGCAGNVAGLLCSLRCGTESAHCSAGGICYCKSEADNNLRSDVKADDDDNDLIKSTDNNDRDVTAEEQADDDDDNDLIKSNNDQIENLENNPALRHHIAHFCPNVELARNCIMTCMAQGKPAFCGKDHVCYCGHRYTERDKDPEDLQNTYKDFKDMYAKYFAIKGGLHYTNT